MKKTRLALIVLLSVLICGCGDDTSSQSNNTQNNDNIYTGSGDVLEDARAARQSLHESVENAKAVLATLDSDGRTSDQVMGKEDSGSGDNAFDEDDTSREDIDYSGIIPQQTHSTTPRDVKLTEGTVLLDEDNLKITYKGMEQGFSSTIKLKLLVENNASEEMIFQTRDLSVNGYMCDAYFSPIISPGKKENTDITFSGLEEKVGIKSAKDIEDITFAFFAAPNSHISDYVQYDMLRLIP